MIACIGEIVYCVHMSIPKEIDRYRNDNPIYMSIRKGIVEGFINDQIVTRPLDKDKEEDTFMVLDNMLFQSEKEAIECVIYRLKGIKYNL